jgi:hypothetical protein
MIRIGKVTIILLFAFFVGCQSIVIPEYALIGTDNEPIIAMKEAIKVKNGWEFQFPNAVDIQKMTVGFEGKLTQLILLSKTNDKWNQIKDLKPQDEYVLSIDLDVNTDDLKLLPKFSGKGHVTYCQFVSGKKQRTFSIQLEKPPFIE